MMNLIPISDGRIENEVFDVVLDIFELDFNPITSRDNPLYDNFQILINFIDQLSQFFFQIKGDLVFWTKSRRKQKFVFCVHYIPKIF